MCARFSLCAQCSICFSMTMKAAHPVIRLVDCTPQISCLASLVIGYPISTGLKFPDLVEKEVCDSAVVPCERLWTLLGVYMAVLSRGICPVLLPVVRECETIRTKNVSSENLGATMICQPTERTRATMSSDRSHPGLNSILKSAAMHAGAQFSTSAPRCGHTAACNKRQSRGRSADCHRMPWYQLRSGHRQPAGPRIVSPAASSPAGALPSSSSCIDREIPNTHDYFLGLSYR